VAAAQTFDISAALERKKLSSFALRLIVVSWLVTFFDGYDMNVIAFATKQLASDFHISNTQLSYVISSGLFGTLAGNFLFGWLGDVIGRRPAIIVAVGAFSILTLVQAFCRTYEALFVVRFFNGLALGGAMPLIWALNVEFAPKRLRATVITLIMLGYGFGVMFAGPIARQILPRFDWPGIFIFGGVVSFIATGLLIVSLPESLRYLAIKGDKPDAIRAVLRRMGVEAPAGAHFVLSDEAPRTARRVPVRQLFAGSLAWLTPLLWIAYFASSVSTFLLTSWGPRILEEMKFSADHAAYISSMNSMLGMTGGLLLMRFTDRHGPIVIAAYPLTAVPLLLIAGLTPMSLTVFLCMLVPISLFLAGGHYGITSIVSLFYPSSIRSMGSGLCSGLAKVGSVIGPLIGGFVLDSGLPVKMTYALLAACPLLYGLSVLGIGVIVRRSGNPAEQDLAAQPAAAPAE
jgi:AAHS family 4-hydroxybenzoate transporter-like MFS transporter